MKPIIFSTERGQALILITLAAIGLFAIAGLAIDGSAKYADRRHAQNAADAAVFAGALAKIKGQEKAVTDPVTWTPEAIRIAMEDAARDRADENGYNGDLVTSQVWVYSCDAVPPTSPTNCGPYDGERDYILVIITSHINTYFARVIGINQIHNTVEAVAFAKPGYSGAPFNKNAIVSLVKTDKGFDSNGDANWIIEGGGIFANSTSSSAAHCQSNSATITVPSVTVAGNVSWGNCTMNIPSGATRTGAPQLSYADYSSWFPRQPSCDGTATKVGAQWYPQSGADGSRVAFSGDMDFAPGLFCVTNSPGPYHGAITGTGVTFYMMRPDFSMKLNGSGNSLTASAPTSGEYKGILIYLPPQVDVNGNLLNTQAMDLRGNGSGDIRGTVIAPSADVTMFGNSGTGVIDSQVIAYQVDSGGTADIKVKYQPNNNWVLNIPHKVGLYE